MKVICELLNIRCFIYVATPKEERTFYFISHAGLEVSGKIFGQIVNTSLHIFP